jgi:hypothetical protein
VEAKEVEDLNIECWQTIIGDDNLPPPLPEYNHRDNLNETISSTTIESNNSADSAHGGNKLTVDRNKGQSLISSGSSFICLKAQSLTHLITQLLIKYLPVVEYLTLT